MTRSGGVASTHVPQALVERMVGIRRTIHAHPELAFEEELTAAQIMAELDYLGLPYSYAGKGSGVVARLDIDSSAPTVALRADMDALPGNETTNLAYASVEEGKMHACGHDAHVAMLLGAAHLLVDSPPDVNVRFVFQPAEERGGGARTVIASGELVGVDMIFAGHVSQHYEVGEAMVADGTITAQSDRFRIDIHGKGGHGARPHEATDAIIIMGYLITALQTLVSREINPLHPSVVTVGIAQGGTAPNVIAETATLQGSIRTTLPAVQKQLHAGVRRMAEALGDLHDAELEVTIEEGYPPVVNTREETALADRAARKVVGDAGMIMLDHPSMGGEDFAYYLEDIPGCYVRFGARTPGSEYVPLHSPAFDIDEDVLPIGAQFFEQVVREAGGAAAAR